MSMGKRLLTARREKGYSQRELAKLTGIHHAQIARYESGKIKNIQSENLERIAKLLDKKVAWFYEEEPGEIYPLAAVVDEILRLPGALTDKQVQALIDFFREFKRESGVKSSHGENDIEELSPKAKEKALKDMGQNIHEAAIHKLPILTPELKAAAGPGEFAEIPPEPLLLAQHRWKKGYRAFNITGNSMEPYIMNGDYVVVDLLRSPVDGDTVLARIDDGLVVKKYYKNKDRVELISINPDYKPLTSRNMAILGVLIDIVRPVKKV